MRSLSLWLNKKVNEEALYHYLTLAVTPAPMTMFQGIEKLEPGHTIYIEMDGKIYLVDIDYRWVNE